MVVGLFLRNYKIYEKYNYVSFSEGENEKFNLFIGNNGAGKSSILEALDTFFNGREFITHTNSRDRDSSIAPVFLIKKTELKQYLNSASLELFTENYSHLLWNKDFTSLYASNPKLREFINNRNELKRKGFESDYYLILLGYEKTKKDTTAIGLDSKMIEYFNTTYLQSEYEYRALLNKLYNAILKHYRYIYIPVETSITEFLKLESDGMQALMNQNLKTEIEGILKHEFETTGTGTLRQRRRQVKIVTYINEKISQYVDSIEDTIQSINTEYHFNRGPRAQTVSAKDFATVVIDAYFTKRKLQLQGKNISNLSAGERKKALVDIAYAFISQEDEIGQEVILAIDEPESSLHISMCYDQFHRIEEIANKYNKQLFVTSHWYGGLPILNKGRLYSISKGADNLRKIDIFSLENYFEERGSHPDDVNLKSFYDLTSSIVSSIRNQEVNWLIVEGRSDKRYLEHYLPNDLNLRVLPVGGCTIVKKIYEYLFLPINASEEARDFKGKVYCLIDTDQRGISIDFPSETRNKILQFRRIQRDGDEIKLCRIQDTLNTETEMEEVLYPERFYEAICDLISINGHEVRTTCGQESIADLASNYVFEVESCFSFIKGSETIFRLNETGRNITRDLNELHIYFDNHKDEICDCYLNLERTESPLWIRNLVKFFN